MIKTKYSSLEVAKTAKDTYGHFIIKKYKNLKKVEVEVVVNPNTKGN